MKHIFFISLATLILSCNNKNTTKENTDTVTDANTVIPVDTTSKTNSNGIHSSGELVSAYLAIKNSLVSSNNSEAAAGAKSLSAALEKLDASSFTADQKKTVDEIKADLKEHADHIENKSADLAHQREHFDMLSRNMIDLVKITGTNTKLYLDFCPMFNDNKGASWLSESKEIRNPYYGDKMMKCGVVKEEIEAK
jgi:hypothetical protein